MENLLLYIESLIFATEKAVSFKDIMLSLNAHFQTKMDRKEVEATIEQLKEKYRSDDYSFEVIEIAGGYQFMTKGAYYPVISEHLKLESKKKLSRAALETLAIISYKQPTTKSSIESIRGVNCDYSIQKLLDKELVEIGGREDGPGRPLLYVTSEKFMNHFGLKSLNELPKLKEFEKEENTIGIKEEE
ncbi:MAG: SMC-Scp complex subunit ScpB [Saprospiraceae bacterium]|nr:SMC-Scp complex subunit ScpB [Bacteroidia bacterium]NNF22323.1 SMC-Scp complex subunit ScpB [Saprospiraceae bacterium]NNK89649.1 SMC-Scp complex subunit ScpB [Saprospiraceae bacterium]